MLSINLVSYWSPTGLMNCHGIGGNTWMQLFAANTIGGTSQDDSNKYVKQKKSSL